MEQVLYTLKRWHSFFDKYENIKLGGTTFDENDLQILNFGELSIGKHLALATYEDGVFFCADDVFVKDIQKDVIILNNEEHFDSVGNYIK